MERIPVSSSNVQAIGYDEGMQTLEVEFNNGAVYQYFNVPKDEYEGLMNASSKGSYMHSNIKPRYSVSKL